MRKRVFFTAAFAVIATAGVIPASATAATSATTTASQVEVVGGAENEPVANTETPDNFVQTRAKSDGPLDRASYKCKSPRGAKFNVSYRKNRADVTFYFNNHCDQKRSLKAHISSAQLGANDKSCVLRVNPHTKGKKRHEFKSGYIVKTVSNSCKGTTTIPIG